MAELFLEAGRQRYVVALAPDGERDGVRVPRSPGSVPPLTT